MKLHGIKPSGEGLLVEVHVDIVTSTPEFKHWLSEKGFEDHPFTVFWPPGYTGHMTGRVRCAPDQSKSVIVEAQGLAQEIVQRGKTLGLDFYVEVELARHVTKLDFQTSHHRCVLDSLRFVRSGKCGAAKADIHAKFTKGMVPPSVREYLLQNHFYWVATAGAASGQAKDIATLQTSSYEAGRRVYELLTRQPLENCIAVHLEQKILMLATSDGIPMPETIDVTEV